MLHCSMTAKDRPWLIRTYAGALALQAGGGWRSVSNTLTLRVVESRDFTQPRGRNFRAQFLTVDQPAQRFDEDSVCEIRLAFIRAPN